MYEDSTFSTHHLYDSLGINPNLTDENGRGALHVANWFNKATWPIYFLINVAEPEPVPFQVAPAPGFGSGSWV